MRALTYAEAQARTRGSLKYLEASATNAMGGMDIDITLVVRLRRFIEEHCIANSCSMERGGGLELFIKSLKGDKTGGLNLLRMLGENFGTSYFHMSNIKRILGSKIGHAHGTHYMQPQIGPCKA